MATNQCLHHSIAALRPPGEGKKGFGVSVDQKERVRGVWIAVLVPASRRNGLAPGMETVWAKRVHQNQNRKESNDLNIMLKCLMICRSVILTFSKSQVPSQVPLRRYKIR